MVEVELKPKEIREFRESLINSNQVSFNDACYQVVSQVVDGLKRKFYLVDSYEDLEKLKKKVLVEKNVIINKKNLSKFLKVCPCCELKQFNSNEIVVCKCGSKFKSYPGHMD